jgi:hypothetical protein
MVSLNSIQQFYAGKTIFITGASGFMGKILIEKILYSCSDVREIIVLMRSKRGKTGAQRIEDFSKLPVCNHILFEYFFFRLFNNIKLQLSYVQHRCLRESWTRNLK